MSSLIICFWRAAVLTFLKNGLKLLEDKALEIIMEGLKQKLALG